MLGNCCRLDEMMELIAGETSVAVRGKLDRFTSIFFFSFFFFFPPQVSQQGFPFSEVEIMEKNGRYRLVE